MMNELRENLIDRMIAIYGYEDKVVIQFCEMCDRLEDNEWNNKILSLLVEAHETRPYNLDEDED